MNQTLSTVMQLFKGLYLGVGAASRQSDLIRPTQTVQRTYFIIYEFCFTCFKVECKRSYIFQSFSEETRIEI